MAKKKKEIKDKGKSKELDMDLDLEDFDEMDEFNLDDREPATTGYSKKELVEDASEFSKQLAYKTSRKILPNEFGYAYDEAVDYKNYVGDVIGTNKTKINKELGRLNREVKKILPGKLKGISDTIGKFLGDTDQGGPGSPSQDEQRNSFITSNLNDIFNKQLEAQAELQATSDATTEVKYKIELGQTKKTHELLTELNNNSNGLNNFTFQIAKEYYKKSLELQYKTYFVQADILETTRNYFKTFSSQFDAISKNTALPEFVKLKNTERLQEIVRTKLTTDLLEKSLGKSGYIDNLKKNFGEFIGNKVDAFTSVVSDLTSGLSMMNDMKGQMGGGSSILKDIAIDVGSDKLSGKISDRYKDKLADNKYVKTGKNIASTFMNSPQVFFNTISEALGKKLKSPDNTMPDFVTDNALSFLNIFKPKEINTRLEDESVMGANQPAIFDNSVYRSITDVIPMYLRKILKENTDLTLMYKTINDKQLGTAKSAEELHYNYTDRKLDTLTNVKFAVRNEIETKADQNRIGNVVNTINTSTKLNSDENSSLARYLKQASETMPADEFTASNLFENYQDNPALKEMVDNDVRLKMLINKVTSSKKYDKNKSDINSKMKSIKDKDNISGILETLNVLLHIGGNNTDISFEAKEIELIVNSFKVYIIRDGGVLTPDSIYTFRPFGNMLQTEFTKLKPKIFSLVTNIKTNYTSGKFEIKQFVLAVLATIDKSIREANIINPEIYKSLYRYNKDLVDFDEKNRMKKINIDQITDVNLNKETVDTDDVVTEYNTKESSASTESATINPEEATAESPVSGKSTMFNKGKEIIDAAIDFKNIKSVDDAKKAISGFNKLFQETTDVINTEIAEKWDIVKEQTTNLLDTIKKSDEFTTIKTKVVTAITKSISVTLDTLGSRLDTIQEEIIVIRKKLRELDRNPTVDSSGEKTYLNAQLNIKMQEEKVIVNLRSRITEISQKGITGISNDIEKGKEQLIAKANTAIDEVNAALTEAKDKLVEVIKKLDEATK